MNFLENTTLWILVFLLPTTFSFAQNGTQVVKGSVLDKQSEMPLIGASIQLVSATETLGTVTDIDGYFRLEGVPIGRQALRISYLGYNMITLPNVEVSSGKEVILDIVLEESVEELAEVVVRAEAQKDKAQNELATVSARTFSVEEVNRFSGGRSDIARLAGNFAGVATANDSRNDIVIRGNSPTGVLWRLEGVPIPNPNHFSTLGTTGGPVSAMNPSLLKNSDFLTSAFPAEYGNALSGVFDVGFRNGNRDKSEYTIQLGAVSGLEAMAEGPFNKKNNGSYIVAARYGFVGLASELGLPIGTNAAPNYQDISFKINFGKSGKSNFTLFGIGGLSDIDFLHDEVDADDLFAANDEDAFAKSRFGVIGLRHNYLIDDKTYWRTVVSASTAQNEFYQERFFNLDTPDEFQLRISDNDNKEFRYTISSYINRKYSKRFTARVGVLAEQFDYNLRFDDRENRPDLDDDGTPDWVTVYNFEEGMTLLQGFAQTQYRLDKKWTINTGLHAQLLTFNDRFALEPRLAINYEFAKNQTLNLGYGLHHQNQPLPILLLQEEVSPGVFEQTNRDLKLTRSHHFVLGYDANLGRDWRAKMELYYQGMENVAIEPTPSSFSILNIGADFGFPDDVYGLVNEGTGRNYGLEVTLEKFYSNGFYSLITASVFDSKYTGSDGVERNTAFNNGYVFNVLAGREFKIGKAKRNVFTIDTKLTTAGGRYYTPVDLEASREAGTEVLIDELAFTERFDPYLRWDLKLGFKLNSDKRKLSHQFYFDVQNVLNRENVFVRRYNRLTNEVNEVFQIGFFPDFMYRIQF